MVVQHLFYAAYLNNERISGCWWVNATVRIKYGYITVPGGQGPGPYIIYHLLCVKKPSIYLSKVEDFYIISGCDVASTTSESAVP